MKRWHGGEVFLARLVWFSIAKSVSLLIKASAKFHLNLNLEAVVPLMFALSDAVMVFSLWAKPHHFFSQTCGNFECSLSTLDHAVFSFVNSMERPTLQCWIGTVDWICYIQLKICLFVSIYFLATGSGPVLLTEPRKIRSTPVFSKCSVSSWVRSGEVA